MLIHTVRGTCTILCMRAFPHNENTDQLCTFSQHTHHTLHKKTAKNTINSVVKPDCYANRITNIEKQYDRVEQIDTFSHTIK